MATINENTSIKTDLKTIIVVVVFAVTAVGGYFGMKASTKAYIDDSVIELEKKIDDEITAQEGRHTVAVKAAQVYSDEKANQILEKLTTIESNIQNEIRLRDNSLQKTQELQNQIHESKIQNIIDRLDKVE